MKRKEFERQEGTIAIVMSYFSAKKSLSHDTLQFEEDGKVDEKIIRGKEIMAHCLVPFFVTSFLGTV